MGEPADRVVKTFIQKLKTKLSLTKVILFGSRVRKDYLKDSDYDFIIVSPDFKDIHFLKRISLVSAYWPSDLPLEALCYTPEEFKKKKEQIGIVKQAIKEGQEIL